MICRSDGVAHVRGRVALVATYIICDLRLHLAIGLFDDLP